MSTRLYYDDNVFWHEPDDPAPGSNPSTPAYFPGWSENNSALRVRLAQGRPGNAFSNMTIQKNVSGSPKYGLHRVYVSDPMPEAFVLSGTVRGQMMCLEQLTSNDAMRAVVIRVWNSVTNVFRSPTVLAHLPTTLADEYSAAGTINHFFPPEVPITPVAVHAGDRIVVEVGTTFFAAGTGATITSQLETGNPAGSPDLPIDQSYTTPAAASWIEFSMDFPTGLARSAGTGLRLGGGISPAGGADILFELASPEGARFDVTDRVALEGLSKVTLAIERNLHEFRAGDLSLTLDDSDGFFSDLFALLLASDRWRLTVDRDHARHFAGVIPGIDSIRFNRKELLCELTALDLSKLLEDVSAESVVRPSDIYALGANISINDTSITLNSTAGLFNEDRFSISEDGVTEEFTIALVVSGIVVQVTQGSQHTFTTAAAIVTLTTPFFRFKTPDFLVNALLDAAGDLIQGRAVSAPTPFSGTPIFSEVNTAGLPSTAIPSAFLQKALKHFVRVGSAVFDQATPEDAWVGAGTDRAWIDWSPYRTQAEGEPGTFATNPLISTVDSELVGVDFTGGALRVWRVAIFSGDSGEVHLDRYNSADGITWDGGTLVATLVDMGVFVVHFAGGDYDSTRDRVYYCYVGDLGQEFGYWDVGGGTKVILDTSEQRAVSGHGNVRYSKEYDGVVVYNSTSKTLEVWRGSNIVLTYSGGFAPYWSPKQTRYLDGVWYTVGYPQGVPSVLFSNDDFANVQQIPLADPPSSGGTTRHLTIVNGTVRVVVRAGPPGGGSPIARYFVVAGSEDWVIPYADFSGQSIINALDDIAIILNCVFWMDVNGVAHFAPRVIGSENPERPVLDDLIIERVDEPVWLELYNYVEVSIPGGGTATAGHKTSTSRNLSVDVQLVDSLAVGQSVAVYLLDFLGKQRRHISATLEDDGTVYGLLDVVSLDGVDWIVYAVERDLLEYTVAIELVEMVE